MAQVPLNSIYGNTALLQITESLALIKLSQVRDLWCAPIVTPLYTQLVYDSAASLALGEMYQIIDNWLQISSYSFMVSPSAGASHYANIIVMKLLFILGGRTRP